MLLFGFEYNMFFAHVCAPECHLKVPKRKNLICRRTFSHNKPCALGSVFGRTICALTDILSADTSSFPLVILK